MPAPVPAFPHVLTHDPTFGTDVRAATPVLGVGQWHTWAQQAAWLLGRGAQLVSLGPYIGSLSTAIGFACYAHPHAHITNWLWVLTLARTSATANVWGHFTGAQGTNLGGWQLDSSLPIHTPQHFTFLESFDAPMSVDYTFTPVIYTDSTAQNVALVSLSAAELPMSELTTAGSVEVPVVDPATCGIGAPIYEPVIGRASVHGLCEAAHELVTGEGGLIQEARRAMMLSWAHPVGLETTNTSFVDLGAWEAAPSIVARHLYNGSNTKPVCVHVRAAVTGAPNTGEVRIQLLSGYSVTIPITSGTLAWYSDYLSAETEDLSRNAIDGGLRGGTRETIALEARVTGGSTSVAVVSMFVMEEEGDGTVADEYILDENGAIILDENGEGLRPE